VCKGESNYVWSFDFSSAANVPQSGFSWSGKEHFIADKTHLAQNVNVIRPLLLPEIERFCVSSQQVRKIPPYEAHLETYLVNVGLNDGLQIVQEFIEPIRIALFE
jgi:hypothetical protein